MEHIVAVFETESAANAAAQDLENAGIASSAIRRYQQDKADTSYSAAAESPPQGSGFWAWLLGEEDGIDAKRAMYPRHDDFYERGMKAGNAVLSVTVIDDAEAREATSILESHDPLQLDDDGRSGIVDRWAAPAASVTPGMTTAPETRASTPGSSTGEQVIPLKEEQVEIGKRMVDHGVTRVRRYVVETPVEKEVTLHGERVTIERRRPIGGVDDKDGAFEERTVEVRETEEVPVVEKKARVVEEVAIKKEATERTETVRDNVRREEVEVTGNDRLTSKPGRGVPVR